MCLVSVAGPPTLTLRQVLPPSFVDEKNASPEAIIRDLLFSLSRASSSSSSSFWPSCHKAKHGGRLLSSRFAIIVKIEARATAKEIARGERAVRLTQEFRLVPYPRTRPSRPSRYERQRNRRKRSQPYYERGEQSKMSTACLHLVRFWKPHPQNTGRPTQVNASGAGK